MVICGWCKKLIRETPDLEGISHGMCQECREWMMENRPGRSLTKFLNSLPVPVVVVDSDATIQTANRAACASLGRDPKQLEGYRCGDALECAHARLPGGCGRSLCCKSCTIRSLVTHTYTTGLPKENIPTYQETVVDATVERTHILLSSYKKDGVVVLKIEEVAPRELTQ